MATKFVGERLCGIKWVPVTNNLLEKPTQCITVGAGDGKRSISLWDCSTDKITLANQQPLSHNATSLAFTSSSTCVVGLQRDQNLEVWNISSELKCIKRLKTANRITSHISTSDKRICSVGEDGFVQIHIPEQASPVYSAKSDLMLHTSCFYLNHSVLVGTAAGQLHNYDTRQPGTPVETMSSELVPILGVTVHNTQPAIVANSRSDGSLLIWDMRNNKYPLATFAGHASAIWEVMFEREKPDNLYTCSEDGQLLLWSGAALSGVGGLLGGGGGVSPWLTPEISHQKMDVFNLLGGDNKLSVNSFDVSNGTVICGGERQTLFCVDSCSE